MKNLLLLLLLANVLYFLWGVFVEEDPQPGTAILEDADLGSSLSAATGRNGNTMENMGMVLASGERTGIGAVVGPSCVTIGPFTVRTDADSAALVYSNEGMKTSVRPTQADVFVGHWVQIRNISDTPTANRMLKTLTDGGLDEAYLVSTEDEGLKISLGLFGDIEGAEKIELQARSLELPADIAPRLEERDVFFVDVRLPPGRGAVAIVEKYGEEQVLMRSKATCPR